MPDLETIDEHIESAIADPQQFSADGESVTSRPLEELINARDRLAAREVRRRNRNGFRALGFAKAVTPGAGRS